MGMVCSAYGMRLRSSFPVAGMSASPQQPGGLPELTLELREPAALDAAWRPAGGPPIWSGRQGDGLDLVIDQGESGDLLFSYGDRARFHLSADMLSLACSPTSESLDWQRILIGKVIPTISVMRGYEALHAASVDSPAGVVGIMGPSGAGKSTLALELMTRGWPLFADDVLVLQDIDGTVSAHPGTAHMNVAQDTPAGLDPEAIGETLATRAGERWITMASASAEPRPVCMLCLLERGPGLELPRRDAARGPAAACALHPRPLNGRPPRARSL